MPFNFVFAIVILLQGVYGQVTNMKTNTLVDHTWMEVGFTFMDDISWTEIKTRTTVFSGDVVAFISLPNIAGETSDEGYPASIKLREAPKIGVDGTVSFAMKLVQPNDSFCENYKPAGYIVPKLQVSWVVVEEGAYKLKNGQKFIISSGNITRLDDSTSATNFNGNIIRFTFPTGCITDGADPAASCQITSTSRSVISHLLTNNNVKETGKDLFLSVRAKNLGTSLVQFILVPHDAANFPSYYSLTAEKLAYWVYEAGVSILCSEQLVIETRSFTGVTNTKLPIVYSNTYDYNPGVYGIIGTVNSLGDSTALRVFDSTNIGSSIITQEDKCDDAETEHTTPEVVYALVLGQSSAISSDQDCLVKFNAATDTFEPTIAPTKSPTVSPTGKPSVSPTRKPTVSPTRTPTTKPTTSPTRKPTVSPTASPVVGPTASPTRSPTRSPTLTPSLNPTRAPTESPTFSPTDTPTFSPTDSPTLEPTQSPTNSPTSDPTRGPTRSPTASPTVKATASPTGECEESVHPIRMTMRAP
jgi:hypothetical protein